MIILKGDGVSLTVEESNPIYRNLKRFVGEVFMVEESGQEEVKKEAPVEEAPKKYYLQEETEPIDLDIQNYYSGLNTAFPNEKSVVRSILHNHAAAFLGAPEKATKGRYLALSSTLHDDVVVLARVLDNKPLYLSVNKELVVRV